MTLDFEKGGGRVTVVTRDARTGAVLMVAHADREALARTESTGEMHYTSRTRGLWRKGETSGNTQKVVRLTPDCDSDAVLADVLPAGPACHEGTVKLSPVLAAMGVDAHRSLRLSVGWSSTDEDVDAVLDALPSVIEDLRRLSG